MKRSFQGARTNFRLLPAFTLMESIVVLLLLVIVFATAATALRITGRQLSEFVSLSHIKLDYLSFSKALKADIENARHVYIYDTEVALHGEKGQKIIYKFGEDFTLREFDQIRTDTFRLTISILEAFFQKERVVNGENRIDEIVISIEEIDVVLPLEKAESAAQLLEWDLDLTKRHDINFKNEN